MKDPTMAHVTLSQSASGNTLAARASLGVATMAQSYANWKQYRTTVRELRNLTNRELRDLGVMRCMITRTARDAVYGKGA
jgi:uncharacterized protein YjiS (DUF1127 family)